jgi:hypothetical protein
MLSADQRATLLGKPYWRLRWFASLLGWKGLRQEWIDFGDDELAAARIVVWYETTDKKFSIQINENPIGQSRQYEAAILSWRYGIGPIGWNQGGWHPFELFDGDRALRAEADRLRPRLGRQQFRNAKLRAAFRAQHPELLARFAMEAFPSAGGRQKRR